MNVIRWCNDYHRILRSTVFLLSLFPSIYLYWSFWQNDLGINPFETLMLFTGQAGIIFILITLGITPCRRWLSALCRYFALPYGKRLSDWNFLIRSRRMLGLLAFYYACLHFGVYLAFEMDFDWHEVIYDIKTRLFLWFGLIAWLLMLALAITSPSFLQRKMGKHWRRLHRCMYVLSICAATHVWMEAKLIEPKQLVYAILIGIFLTHRVVVFAVRKWRRADDTGMIATR